MLEFAREALGEAQGYRWRKDGVEHLDTRTRVRVNQFRQPAGHGAWREYPNHHCRRAGRMGSHGRAQTLERHNHGPWKAENDGGRSRDSGAGPAQRPRDPGGHPSSSRELVTAGLVSLLQAEPDSWRDFQEVLRVNPVAAINPYLRRTLEREHKAAIESERAARTFRQFRLNIPGDPVDHQPLVTGAEWERVTVRPVPDRATGGPS